MPNVPQVPGVPSLGSYSSNDVGLVVADAIIAAGQLLPSQWGVYANGLPVILPATVLLQNLAPALNAAAAIASFFGVPNIVPTIASTNEFDFSADAPVSNYPQEQGAFQSYDKVTLPPEVTLKLICSGPGSQRQAFLSTLDSLLASPTLVTLVTPERVFPDYTLIHVDYHRTGSSGVTMIAAVCRFELVPFTASQQFTNTQQPGEAGQQSIGVQQPQTPTQEVDTAAASAGWN